MGSKFLGGDDSTDLAELQLGTFPINISSAVVQSLAGSLPVRTNADRMLTSGLIQLTDCNFSPLTNPASENLDLASYAITDVKEMLLESNATPSTPPADMLTLYSYNDKLRYKDDTTATFQVATSTDLAAYLLKSGGTMTGSIDVGNFNLSNVNTINSKVANDLIINSGTATAGRIATFASDKVIQDSGTLLSSLATTAAVSSGYVAKSGSTMTGDLITSTQIRAREYGIAELKVAPTTPLPGTGIIYGEFSTRTLHYLTDVGGDKILTTGGPYLPTAGGTMTGSIAMGSQEITGVSAVRTSGLNVLMGNNVAVGTNQECVVIGYGAEAKGSASGSVCIGRNALSQTVSNIAIGLDVAAAGYQSIAIGVDSSTSADQANVLGYQLINNTSGSLLIDSYTNFRSNSTTCNLGTTTNPFQNLYLNGSFIGSGTTESTSVTTGAITTAGGIGVAKNANIGGKIFLGAAQTTAVTPRIVTTGGSAGAIAMYTSDQYPIVHFAPFGHDSAALYFDCYNNGSLRASSANSSFSISKSATGLNFAAAGAATVGNVVSQPTAGSIDTAGLLQWNKAIKTADTTASTSISTGAIVSAGGLGVAKNIYCGDGVFVTNGVSCATISCTSINSTSPATCSGYAGGGFVVPFTASTAKIVTTAVLTELSDPSGQFTPISSGFQYTGTATRTVLVRILYNILVNASAQTYRAWVSKNASLTQVAPRDMNFTTAMLAGYMPFEVSNIYQMSTNDTFQLAAFYTATGNVNVFDIQVQIIPII